MKNDAFENIKTLNACLKHCFAGNVTHLAKAFGVTRQQVYNWQNGTSGMKKVVVHECLRRLRDKGKVKKVRRTSIHREPAHARRPQPVE